MIENEMERFREHEKEFKMKQYSKRALAADFEKKGNFVDRRGGSNSSRSYGDQSDDSDYGDDMSNGDYGSDVEAEGEEELSEDLEIEQDGENNDPMQLSKDKEWLDQFIQDKLKKQITKVEQEVDNIRNKKIRGATKKQKDMLKALNDKLKLMRATRENCEELAMTMEFLEGGAIKGLKQALKKYYDDHEDESLRNNVDKQCTALIELADNKRKTEDLLKTAGIVPGQPLEQEEEIKLQAEDNSKWGHLGWLHDMVNLNLTEYKNIYLEKKIDSIDSLSIGNIIDAQDYLGTWHLSIVCKIQPKNEQEYLKLNFLPYPKGNRDEWISKTDVERISGPFVNTDTNRDPEKIKENIKSLNDYYQQKIQGIKAKDDSSKEDHSKKLL